MQHTTFKKRDAKKSSILPFDHLAGNLGPYELFGVVEARLDQIGQVVVLGGADQP